MVAAIPTCNTPAPHVTHTTHSYTARAAHYTHAQDDPQRTRAQHILIRGTYNTTLLHMLSHIHSALTPYTTQHINLTIPGAETEKDKAVADFRSPASPAHAHPRAEVRRGQPTPPSLPFSYFRPASWARASWLPWFPSAECFAHQGFPILCCDAQSQRGRLGVVSSVHAIFRGAHLTPSLFQKHRAQAGAPPSLFSLLPPLPIDTAHRLFSAVAPRSADQTVLIRASALAGHISVGRPPPFLTGSERLCPLSFFIAVAYHLSFFLFECHLGGRVPPRGTHRSLTPPPLLCAPACSKCGHPCFLCCRLGSSTLLTTGKGARALGKKYGRRLAPWLSVSCTICSQKA